MGKIREYIKLVKTQRKTGRDMQAARNKITHYQQQTYNLCDTVDFEIIACINMAKQVSSADTVKLTDEGFTKYCYLFNEHQPCEYRNCLFFSDNFDYVVAKERYDAAVAARRKFLRELCKGRGK